MIWHVVRLDFRDVDERERAGIEADLAGLAAIDEVAWLRVGRDVADDHVTGLLTVFRTAGDLATYRTHPDHVPVVERIRACGAPMTRFDVETDDDPRDLPA